MAKITKDDLIGLTNSEIKDFYVLENFRYLPPKIRVYIEEGRESFTMGIRVNRIEKLLNVIVIERFINGEIK